MTRLNGWRTICGALSVCVAMANPGHAQTFRMLFNFDFTHGAWPTTPLAQGVDGNLYGTTYQGSVQQAGILFRVDAAGSLRVLHNFCSQVGCPGGPFPWAGLLLASDGNFYGTTMGGTIFRVTPADEFTTVYKFHPGADGYEPEAPLIEGADGNLYGTTSVGGIHNGGSIFKISKTGLTTLNSIKLPFRPGFGALAQGEDGIYGSGSGGLEGGGGIFKITDTGLLTTLYTFCSQANCADGYLPSGPLLASNGSIYGTTLFGGANSCGNYQQGRCGTVFRITPNGKFTTLYSFCSQPNCADGTNPRAGLIQATDGALYGVTSDEGNPFGGCGTMFKITLDGSLTTLYSFDPATDGCQPFGGLLQATDGNFYGTTEFGGSVSGSYGTVFSLSTGLSPFVAFVHGYGKVGQTGGILGQGFTGTTVVSLNGSSAKFTVKSDTLILATVPQGATTGYVTVTTPSGTLTSNVPFRVLP